MNRDFVEMLSGLTEAGVEYLLVGAHALAVIGRSDFVANKKATGRPKDLADLALLGEGASEK